MLYNETFGDAHDTIVFLHGIGGTSRYWKTRVKSLSSSYHLILIDLLGYGQSPKPWTKYTVDRHVEELYRVLYEHESLTIVGHSFGAIIALAFAARYPHLVKRLVLISLPYFGDKAGAFRYFRNSNLADRYVMTNIAFAALACVMTRYVLRWLLPYVLRDMPREVVQDLTRHTWRSYTSSVWDGIYRHDLLDDTTQLDANCDILFLHGELDETAPLSGVKQLMHGHPDWPLCILANADHHPLLLDPQWCVRAINSIMNNSTIDCCSD
ncbi:MAG: alpha/beta hydrolase [Gammaproteobacteria bacterium]|nr:alpha/beta hydrolase [Gammaproteobacteria bacterium]